MIPRLAIAAVFLSSFILLILPRLTPVTAPVTPWPTYSTSAFSFTYPPDYSVTAAADQTTLTSPSISCQTAASGSLTPIAGYDVKITLTPHTGSGYAAIWRQAFGFDFTPSGPTASADGLTAIAGKSAYYFYQGAEMPYGRTAYLVDLSPTTALEINIWTPELLSDCTRPLDKVQGNKIAAAVLSSIVFPPAACPAGQILNQCKLGPCCCPVGALCD